MKLNRFSITIMAAVMFSAGGLTQSSPGGSATANGPASAAANQNTQPAGREPAARLGGRTALQVELSKSVDAKKAKPGDPVEAKLMQDVKSDGQIVLHRGATLVGHVTEAKARSKESPESRLGIVFEKAAGKGSEEFTFMAVVIALAPPRDGPTNIAGDPNRLSSGPAMGGQPFGAGHSVGGPSASAAPAVEAATQGLGTSGTLTAESRGAIGLPGVALKPSVVDGVQGTAVISGDRNVKLENGTQMVLLVSGERAAR